MTSEAVVLRGLHMDFEARKATQLEQRAALWVDRAERQMSFVSARGMINVRQIMMSCLPVMISEDAADSQDVS